MQRFAVDPVLMEENGLPEPQVYCERAKQALAGGSDKAAAGKAASKPAASKKTFFPMAAKCG